ncbi:MAG: PAS domain S-box protein [Salibacteraceae bacterium]
MPDLTSKERIEEINRYGLSGSLPRKELDDIAKLTAQICDVPVSMITLLYDNKQITVSNHGLDLKELPIDDSFCAKAVDAGANYFSVTDARKDERFQNNPLVISKPNFVFYAGAPLVTNSGIALGTLCVFDRKSRKLGPDQIEALNVLRNQVVQFFELNKGRLEQSQHNELLQSKSEQLENIIEATRVGTWEWHIPTKKVFINERWAEIIGYKKDEITPLSIDFWYHVVHPDDVKYSDDKVKDCFEGRADYYDIECRMFHKDGHIVWVNDRGRVVKWDGDGKPLVMTGTHTDITERKQNEAQFKTIADNIPGAVFRYVQHIDGKDDLEQVSQGAKKLWGVEPDEAIKNNQLIWGRYDKRDLDAHFESIKKSKEELRHWQHEWRYHHPDGSLRWHRGAGNPTRTSDGGTYWDSIVLDITEQVKTREELGLSVQNLRERIKEQKCLNSISKITFNEQSERTLLESINNIIPEGFQFPEHTVASITYKKEVIYSSGIKNHKSLASSNQRTIEGNLLYIEVYIDERADKESNDLLLNEEQILLNNIAEIIVLKLNQLAISKNHELILESTGEGIYGIDHDGLCTFINPSAAEMLGYEVKEVLGKNVHDLIHSKHIDGSDFPEADCPIFKSRTELSGCRVEEDLFWRKDGDSFLVRYSSTPIIENGKAKGAVIVFNDITRQKEVERKVKFNEVRFRTLVENSGDAVAIINPDGTVSFVSSSIKNVLGYNEKEALEIRLDKLMHPDDQDGIQKVIGKALEEPGIPQAPHVARAKHKKGHWVYAEAIITNMLHDPVINGIVDNFRDVTERIETEKKIRENEKNLEEAQRLAKMGSWDFDLENALLSWSNNLYDVFGIKKKDFDGKHQTYLGFIDPEHREMVKKSSLQTQKTGKKFNIEYRIITPSGAKRIIKEYGYGEKDETGKVFRLFGTAQDITELVQTQEQLIESESRYRGFYESQTNYVIRTDMAGNYTYVNKKFKQDFGWVYTDENQVIGRNCLPSICEYHHERVGKVVEQCVNNPQKVFKVEIDKPTEKGGIVTTIWDFVCIVDAEGNPSEIQCMGIDISDRIKFEKKLQESNERYHYVNKATKEAIFEWNVSKDEFSWGDGFKRLLGYDQWSEPFRLKTWLELTHHLDIAAYQAEWEAFLNDPNQERWQNTFRFKKADDTYIYVEENSYMIRDEKGNPQRMIGALRDVTQTKRSEIQQNLKQHIAELFNDQKELESILKSTLKYLSRFGDFAATEIWLKSKDGNYLNQSSYFTETKMGRKFYRLTKHVKHVGPGEGLPGKVYETQRVQEWENIDSEADFLRHEAAQVCDLKTALGVPLMQSGKLIGVLVILSVDGLDHERTVPFLGLIDTLGVEIVRKQQEEELKLIFNSTPEIIATVSPESKFLKVNPAFCEITGYSEEELTSEPIFNFIHPEDRDGTIDEYKDNISGKRLAGNYINRYRTKSGGYRWISWNSSNVFGDEGYMFAFGRDVTAIKELQDLLERATKLSKVGSWELNLANQNGQSMYWSSMTREILEVGDDYNPTITNGEEFYSQKDKDQMAEAVEALINEGVEFDLEMLVTTAKGNKKWIRCIGQSQREGDKCLSIYGSYQDIHDRKVAEQNITQSNERFNKVAEATNDAIWDRNIEKGSLYLGSGFGKLFGAKQTQKQTDTKYWDKNVHASDLERVSEDLQNALDDPSVTNWSSEYRYRKEDGSYATVIDRGVIIRDQSGKAVRMVGAMTDITYRKQYEDSLRTLNESLEQRAHELAISNQELEQFAYVASHDLQEPLRMISSFLTQLEKRYGHALDAKGHQYIHYAVDGAYRMRQIILDLLEFSRVGKIESKIESISLTSIVEEVKRLLNREIENTGAKIYYDELPIIESYKAPLIQVFQNLISNALKYRSENTNPIIKVSSKKNKGYLQVTIADNGIGIEEEYFDKIFVIFQRLHAKEQYSGTGVGLALVKKTIESLGGKVWVSSTIHKGSEFHFIIPLSKAKEQV